MAGVQPSKFINYISQFKKLLVTRNNGAITQKFKIDSNITDDYYFSIVNSKNQLVDLTGRSFKIYGSIIDAKQVMHILFYSSTADISTNGLEMHFKIDTYTSQYMAMIKNDKVIDLTIIEVIQPQNQQPEEDQITQVILRDQALAYKRPYIENQVPAEILERVILTTNVPLTGVFGAGQDISLTIGSNGAAFGTGLDQTGNNQLVIGQYNEVDNTKAFVIGNGQNDSNRSNIFTIDYQGNVNANAINAEEIFIDGSRVAGVSDIPTGTSQLTNDANFATQEWVLGKGYITGYTAGTGISINNGVISVAGELGKTYYADNNTLQLNEQTNTFSIKSLSSKLNAGQHIILTEDANGVVTIASTGGGGGGGTDTYLAGTGLSLSTVEEGVYQFNVDQAWITGYIESATSGLENYTAGEGIAIEDNVISLTATIPSIEGLASQQYVNVAVSVATNDMATQTWVGQQGYLTAVPDTYATTGQLEAVSGELNNAIGAKANATDLQNYVQTSTMSAYATSAWVDQNYMKSGDVPTDVYTKDEVNAISTALSTAVSEADYANQSTVEGLSTALSSAITGVVDSLSSKANVNDVYTKNEVYTYLETDAKISEATSGKADKTTVDTISGNLNTVSGKVTAIEADYLKAADIADMATQTWVKEQGYLTAHQSLDDYATKTYANTASANAVNVATGWVNDQNYLTEHQSLDDYYNKTEVNAISTALSSAVSGAGYLTAHQSLDNYYTKSEVYTKAETDSAIQTASGNIESWANGKFLSAHQDISNLATKEEVSTASGAAVTAATDWVSEQNYLTGIAVDIEDDERREGLNELLLGKDFAFNSEFIGLNIEYIITANAIATAGDIPTNVSELTNDAGYLTAVPDTVSAAAVDAATGWVSDQNYTTTNYVDTVSSALNNVIASNTEKIGTVSGKVQNIRNDYVTSSVLTAYVNNQYVAVSQLANDVGYITAGDFPAGTVYLAGTGLDLNNATFSVDEEWLSGKIAQQGGGGGTTYTAGDGIAISNQNVISLTATIPTNTNQLTNGAEFATSSYVQTASANAVNVATGWVDGQDFGGNLTVGYYNGDDYEFSYGSCSSLTFDDKFRVDYSDYDNTAIVHYNGVKLVGTDEYDDSVEVNTEELYFNTDEFILNDGDGHVDIALKTSIPTAISDLTNDSDFTTSANVSAIITGYGYATTSQISDMATQTWVGQQNFATTSQLPTDYTTSAQVSAIASAYAQGGGGGGSTISSVYNLLSAGPNIALVEDSSTGITTISGTEGGSSVEITNKQAKLTIAGDTVQYSPDYEIFETTQNAIVDSTITIPAIANVNLGSDEVATFELWINPSATITGFALADGYTLVGQLPQTVTNMYIQVFKVRLYNSPTGLKSFISYEYEFENPFYTPLTFKAIGDGSNGIAISRTGNPSAITLNYSKNGGAWTAYSVGDIIQLSQNDTVAFSGNNDHFSKDWDNYYRFNLTGTIEGAGNTQSLMNFSYSCTEACYVRMFSGCSQLVKAPTLPATTIAPRCYAQLFQGTKITTPPQLPATTLGDQCYRMMFYSCSNLTSVPDLPVTELADGCYNLMFDSCTSISSVSVNLLPATTLANSCYHSMFQNCSKLTNAPQLPATGLANYCYYSMFNGCTSLTTPPPVLPATGIVSKNYCYTSMFGGCTNLVTSPDIKLTTIYNSIDGIAYMFQGCSKLSNIRVELSGWGSSDNWVNGVAANGTFTCPATLGTNETITRGNSRCPTNWTVINV